MATYTGYFGWPGGVIGAGTYSLGITLNTYEYPVTITVAGEGDYWTPPDTTNRETTFTMYLTDTSGNNGVRIDERYVQQYSWGPWDLSKTINATGLAGKALAITFSGLGAHQNRALVTITTAYTTTPCGSPSNVGLSSSVSEGNATLSWTAGSAGVNNAISQYRIQYRDSANGSSGWGAWADYTTTTGASVSVAPPNTRGYYRQFQVRTEGSAGSSYYSSYVASGTLRKNLRPGTPTGLNATPAIWESGNISLTWNAAAVTTSAISYYVIASRVYNGSSWGAWSGDTNVGNVTSYQTAPSIDRGNQIQYRVAAVDARGAKGEYANFTAVTRNTLPGVPTGLSATPVLWERGSVALSWTAAQAGTSAISFYQLSYSVSSGEWTDPVNIGNVTSYSVEPSFLTRGESVVYRIRAVDSLGAAGEWVQFTAVVKNSLPTIPTNVHISPEIYESGGITITWNGSTDPDNNLRKYWLTAFYSEDGENWTMLLGFDYEEDTPRSTCQTRLDLNLETKPSLRGKFFRISIYASDRLNANSAQAYSNTIRINTTLAAPTFIYPIVSEIDDYKTLTPAVKVSYSADPEGMPQTINYEVASLTYPEEIQDSGSVNVGTGAGIWCHRFSLHADQNDGLFVTVRVWMNDGLIDSPVVHRGFVIYDPSWARSVSAGDVIADTTISHMADLTEMCDHVNAKRAKFGLAQDVALTMNGYFAYWKQNMETLIDGIMACYAQVDETPVRPTQEGMYPTAAYFNAVRALIWGA